MKPVVTLNKTTSLFTYVSGLNTVINIWDNKYTSQFKYVTNTVRFFSCEMDTYCKFKPGCSNEVII